MKIITAFTILLLALTTQAQLSNYGNLFGVTHYYYEDLTQSNMVSARWCGVTNELRSRTPHFFEWKPEMYYSNNYDGCWLTWARNSTNELTVSFQWLVETNAPRGVFWTAQNTATNWIIGGIYLTNWSPEPQHPPPPTSGEDSFIVYSNLLMTVSYKGGKQDLWMESIPFLTYKRAWKMQKVYDQ